MSNMIKVVKPVNNFLHNTFTVRTKDLIEYKMAEYGIWAFGGNRDKSYTGRVDRKGEFIFLSVAQKFRRKTKLVPLTKKHTKKTGENKSKFKVEVIREGHWEVRVYKFPLSRVITAKQENRTFKITITG